MKLTKIKYTVKGIFEKHWEEFKQKNIETIRPIEIEEVEKMLACKDEKRGYYVYKCMACGNQHKLALGCNSRLCSCCGKRYIDQWTDRINKKLLKNIEHRHLTFTMPNILWNEIKLKRELIKTVMDTVAKTIKTIFLPRGKTKNFAWEYRSISSFWKTFNI